MEKGLIREKKRLNKELEMSTFVKKDVRDKNNLFLSDWANKAVIIARYIELNHSEDLGEETIKLVNDMVDTAYLIDDLYFDRE